MTDDDDFDESPEDDDTTADCPHCGAAVYDDAEQCAGLRDVSLGGGRPGPIAATVDPNRRGGVHPDRLGVGFWRLGALLSRDQTWSRWRCQAFRRISGSKFAPGQSAKNKRGPEDVEATPNRALGDQSRVP